MAKLVWRWGRIGFAAASSLVWFVPMAVWAGSVDLQPGIGPWIAFAAGAILLLGWLAMLARLGRYPVEARPRRLDVARMSAAEKCWNAVLFVSAAGVIGWLNGAATVDWSSLTPGLAAGRAGAILLGGGLTILLLVFAAGAVFSWQKAGAAFRSRSR